VFLLHIYTKIRGGKVLKILLQDKLIFRNEATVDIEDRGYQFGDGVYEVIKVYDGKPFYLNKHLDRLERSALEIKLALPFAIDVIRDNLLELVKETSLIEGHIYLQITRGTSERTHHFPTNTESVFVAYTKKTNRPISQQQNGIKTILTEDIRWLRCDIKSLNLLGNVLAKQQAKESGADEAIFHRGDTVTEGSSTNLFIIKDRIIYTHPANNLILNGITRDVCFEIIENSNYKINQETFSVKDLLAADEVFVTSTTMEIVPVVQIDNKLVGDGNPGIITRSLQSEFEEYIS
jgi:D-alanine transaminase